MKDRPKYTSSAIGELALWLLSGLFLSALAITALTGAKYLFGWSESQWVVSSVAVGVLSLTWGSWAALLWTQSRALKALMVAIAVVPGVVMFGVGVWAFLNVPDNPWVWRTGWLIVAGHGLGAVVVAALLAGRNMWKSQSAMLARPRRLAAGWTLYPMLVVAGAVGVVAVTFALLPDLLVGEDTTMSTMARWVIPSQALILLTTVLPAGAAQVCDFLTRYRES